MDAIATMPVRFAGADLTLDLSGALWWARHRLLVVADLHLEKGSAYAPTGQLLPPYDTPLTLRRLSQAMARLRPQTVLALGDSFHDAEAGARIAPADIAVLRRLTGSADFIWVCGNHDPEPPRHLGGRILAEWRQGDVAFRHQPEGQAGPAVIGHFHPVASLSVRGRGMRRRCFAIAKRMLALPAFGAYVGGLNVLDRAFLNAMQANFEVVAIGQRKLHRLALGQLRPDPPPLANTPVRRRA